MECRNQERLFYIGLTDDYFNFPYSLFAEDEYITCREALDDLPSLENLEEVSAYPTQESSDYQKLIKNNSTKLTNHQPTRHTAEVISVIKQVPEGGNYKDLPPGVVKVKFNEAWTRYDGNSPSRTIDTGHRNHFHYEYIESQQLERIAGFSRFQIHSKFVEPKHHKINKLEMLSRFY